jgi:hypothetical protein
MASVLFSGLTDVSVQAEAAVSESTDTHPMQKYKAHITKSSAASGVTGKTMKQDLTTTKAQEA